MLCLYLIFNLIYILGGSYAFFTGIINNFAYKEYSIGIRFILVVNIIILLAIIWKKWRKKDLKILKRNIYFGILLCMFFGILSMLFAFDKKVALEGCCDRYEGLYAILYYLTLMALSTFVTDRYKKTLVNFILICGAIQAVYAGCQVFNLFNVKKVLHGFKVYDETVNANVYNSEIWATGFTNNPNFFGTYMLICFSYSIGLFIESKKIWKNIVYTIFISLFMFGLLIANTMSCVIGLTLVLGIILIYCLKNKYYIKLMAVVLLLICMTFLAVKLEKTKILGDTATAENEVTQIIKGNVNDKFGNRRIYIWKETLKIVPKYIWHGVGIDNFHKAFDGKALIVKDGNYMALYDKAHNEYLQILVTQGIFALASYLFIFGYSAFLGIKEGFRKKQIYLVLPVIGYLVQAFFNISVIEVAPIFYMALGLCCSCKNENN